MKEAQRLGITDATIVNASGLNQSIIIDGDREDEDRKTKKRKMKLFQIMMLQIIAKHLLENYPELQKSPLPHADFAGVVESSNLMLESIPNYRAGVDELKTGNSEKEGSFVASTNQKWDSNDYRCHWC